MRFNTIIATSVLWLGGIDAGAQPAWLNDKFLDAVRQVESGGNCNAKSAKGALGPYQIMPATWKEFAPAGTPFDQARIESVARPVCKAYYLWCYRTISRNVGHEATWQECAVCYNGGYGRLRKTGYKWQKMPTESTHYVYKITCELKKNGVELQDGLNDTKSQQTVK